jgi:hypothetical protein
LQQLLLPLSQQQGVQFSFEEKRFSLFFKQAKIYRGIIAYIQPNTFIKQLYYPDNKKFVISNNQLRIYSQSTQETNHISLTDNHYYTNIQTLSLAEYPQFKQLNALFSALLQGNSQQLIQYYNYTIHSLSDTKIELLLSSKNEDAFLQEETPQVQNITIIFVATQIKKIIIQGLAGERSEMIINPLTQH